MLYLTLLTNILIVVSALIGIGILNYVEKDQQLFTRLGDRFIITTWLGILALSISLLTLALILPLSPLVGIITALTLILLTNISEKNRQEIIKWKKQCNINHIIVLITLTLITSYLMANTVTWLDTGLYHFGAIQWLREYGIVPGVGLIHSRFGFVSSWFAFSAAINSEIFGGRVGATANCVVFTIAVFHLLIAIRYILQGQGKITDWFITILLSLTLPILTFSFFKNVLISPSPDIPVTILTEVLVWCILFLTFRPNYSGWLNVSLLPLILSIGIFSIKLSGLPLLIISYFFYIFGQQFSYKKLIMGTAISLFLTCPVLIAGIIITGCPLYPAQLMCLDLPWSIPHKIIQEELDQVDFGHYLSLDMWVKNTTNLFMILLGGTSLFVIVIMGKYLWREINKIHNIFAFLWILSLAIFGGAFFLIRSPMLRFTLPYLLMIPALIISVLCDKYQISSQIFLLCQSPITRLKSLLQSRQKVFLSSLTISCFIIVLAANNPQKNLILPPDYIYEPTLIPSIINDVEYVYPRINKQDSLRSFCWDAELPCALGKLEYNIKLRDPAKGIAGGFVNVK